MGKGGVALGMSHSLLCPFLPSFLPFFVSRSLYPEDDQSLAEMTGGRDLVDAEKLTEVGVGRQTAGMT